MIKHGFLDIFAINDIHCIWKILKKLSNIYCSLQKRGDSDNRVCYSHCRLSIKPRMPTIGGNVPLNLLLILCFAAFISIGLPNSILGSAWPIMYQDLHVSIGNAGIISMIISGGMILSGLTSARIIKRFGTGTTIVVGKAIMAASLIGFAVSDHFLLLCVFALPLGFGIGVIDTGSMVSLRSTTRHDT